MPESYLSDRMGREPCTVCPGMLDVCAGVLADIDGDRHLSARVGMTFVVGHGAERGRYVVTRVLAAILARKGNRGRMCSARQTRGRAAWL